MPEIIKIDHMTKDYGKGRGIFDFNFSISEGEIFGLVGTNGSGKTTTLRHLMGFLAPDSGSCEIGGLNCRKSSAEIMKKVGYVPGEIDFPDVGRGMYDPNMPKLYRIGFANEAEYQEFIRKAEFQIERSNDKYRHALVTVPMPEMNRLIRQLAGYDMRYIRYIPYSLEMYYTKVIEKGGN